MVDMEEIWAMAIAARAVEAALQQAQEDKLLNPDIISFDPNSTSNAYQPQPQHEDDFPIENVNENEKENELSLSSSLSSSASVAFVSPPRAAGTFHWQRGTALDRRVSMESRRREILSDENLLASPDIRREWVELQLARDRLLRGVPEQLLRAADGTLAPTPRSSSSTPKISSGLADSSTGGRAIRSSNSSSTDDVIGTSSRSSRSSSSDGVNGNDAADSGGSGRRRVSSGGIPNCSSCGRPVMGFAASLVRSVRHCANCDRPVCNTCSLQRLHLPGPGQLMRVCDACYTHLTTARARTHLRATGKDGVEIVFWLAMLPACMWRQANLVELDLSNNGLTAISAGIGQLRLLVRLNLDRNRLSRLPHEIGSLTRLQHFYLAYNLIHALPTSIGCLSALVHLDASHNRLVALPDSLSALYCLEHIYLRGNRDLRRAGAALDGLGALKHADLSAAPLGVLPAFAVNPIARLTKLRLAACALRSLQPTQAAVIGSAWADLTLLDLSRNHLSRMPAAVTLLENLVELLLDHNPLEFLGAEVARLTQLERLSLRGCRLRALPGAIGRLTRLRALVLAENRLEVLPLESAHLHTLQVLELGGNPALVRPPPGVARSGAAAVVRYFRALRQEGTAAIGHLSVLTAGTPGSGKTSLVQSLLHGRPVLSGQASLPSDIAEAAAVGGKTELDSSGDKTDRKKEAENSASLVDHETPEEGDLFVREVEEGDISNTTAELFNFSSGAWVEVSSDIPSDETLQIEAKAARAAAAAAAAKLGRRKSSTGSTGRAAAEAVAAMSEATRLPSISAFGAGGESPSDPGGRDEIRYKMEERHEQGQGQEVQGNKNNDELLPNLDEAQGSSGSESAVAYREFDVLDFGGQSLFGAPTQVFAATGHHVFLLVADLAQSNPDTHGLRNALGAIVASDPGATVLPVGTRADLCPPHKLSSRIDALSQLLAKIRRETREAARAEAAALEAAHPVGPGGLRDHPDAGIRGRHARLRALSRAPFRLACDPIATSAAEAWGLDNLRKALAVHAEATHGAGAAAAAAAAAASVATGAASATAAVGAAEDVDENAPLAAGAVTNTRNTSSSPARPRHEATASTANATDAEIERPMPPAESPARPVGVAAAEVPRTWCRLAELIAERRRRGVVLLPMTEFEELRLRAGFGPDGRASFLEAMHHLSGAGVILWFPDALPDTVFVQPRWVVGLLHLVFREDLRGLERLPQRALRRAGSLTGIKAFRARVQALRTEGIVTRKLLSDLLILRVAALRNVVEKHDTPERQRQMLRAQLTLLDGTEQQLWLAVELVPGLLQALSLAFPAPQRKGFHGGDVVSVGRSSTMLSSSSDIGGGGGGSSGSSSNTGGGGGGTVGSQEGGILCIPGAFAPLVLGREACKSWTVATSAASAEQYAARRVRLAGAAPPGFLERLSVEGARLYSETYCWREGTLFVPHGRGRVGLTLARLLPPPAPGGDAVLMLCAVTGETGVPAAENGLTEALLPLVMALEYLLIIAFPGLVTSSRAVCPRCLAASGLPERLIQNTSSGDAGGCNNSQTSRTDKSIARKASLKTTDSNGAFSNGSTSHQAAAAAVGSTSTTLPSLPPGSLFTLEALGPNVARAPCGSCGVPAVVPALRLHLLAEGDADEFSASYRVMALRQRVKHLVITSNTHHGAGSRGVGSSSGSEAVKVTGLGQVFIDRALTADEAREGEEKLDEWAEWAVVEAAA